MMRKIEYRNIGEEVYEGELENGLRIRVIPKSGFSSCYAVFGTNYGGAMRRFEIDGEIIDTPAGVAHFLEHKMFDMPNGDNALGILSQNGADPNAFTSSGVTFYYFKCTENFEENLKMLLRFVSTPYFTPETVEKEQGIIGQEILMCEDNPGNKIYYNLLNILYDHHPIKDKVAGSIESIAQITDKTLYDCHKVFYAPSNMVLCVEGDVDPEKVFEIADSILPKEIRSIPHADFGEKESLLPVSKKITDEMAVSAPLFCIGAKLNADAPIKERLIANLALKLLVGPSSPFYSRLYSDGLITHDFDCETDYSANVGYVILSGESSCPEKIFEELINECTRIANNGFKDDYFSRALKSTQGFQLRALEEFDEICVSTAFALLEGYSYFDTFNLIGTITKEECQNWIKENLASDRLAISIINPIRTN